MEVETLFYAPLLADAAGLAVTVGPPVSPRTRQWWHAALRDLDRALGSGRAIDEVQRHDITQWHNRLLSRVSAVTANNQLRAVRIVYTRLVRLNLVAENPAALIPYAPQPPRRPQAVTRETYERLLSVAGARERAFLALLWGTGCRIGEVPTIMLPGLSLWDERGRPALAAFVAGKYHRRLSLDHAGRYVYAGGPEAAAVAEWLSVRPPAPSDALFTDRAGRRPVPVATLQSALRLLRERAGLPPTTIANAHAFRHAFAYRKRREGYPLEWISEWLGHSDPAFTAAMYGDKSEPEVRRRFFAPPPGRVE